MWYKLRDNSYIDLSEVCAVRANFTMRTICIQFKHSGFAEYNVVNPTETLKEIMKILTGEET